MDFGEFISFDTTDNLQSISSSNGNI